MPFTRMARVALLLLAAYIEAPQAAAQSAASAAAQSPAYQEHLARATGAASGIATNVLNQCMIPSPSSADGRRGRAEGARAQDGGPPGRGRAGGGAQTLEPGKAFDNLYFVGLPSVSAWAISTSAGIILVDALNNSKDAETAIVPGLRSVGLDAAQIKYLIITHSHGDHYDSADRFNAIARRAGVDVFVSNHGFVDGTPTKLPALRTRKPGEPNPYVIGSDAVQNVLTVLSECAKARETVVTPR